MKIEKISRYLLEKCGIRSIEYRRHSDLCWNSVHFINISIKVLSGRESITPEKLHIEPTSMIGFQIGLKSNRLTNHTDCTEDYEILL